MTDTAGSPTRTVADASADASPGSVRNGVAVAAGAAVLAQCGALRVDWSAWPAVVLHATAAGLLYLLLVNLGRRRLGVPLIAAVLFAAHPVAAATVARHGWQEVGGAASALLSGVLLARTPLDRRLLWPALAVYAVSLPLAPGFAATPFLVAAAIVAYHGLEPARLFSKRLLPRFAVFLGPLVAWAAWSVASPGVRGFAPATGDAVAITFPFLRRVDAGVWFGAAVVVTLAAFGLLGLRARPRWAWPLLAASLSLVAAATLHAAWDQGPTAYAPLAFGALLFAEAIEELSYRFGAVAAAPLLFVVYAALAALSWLRAGG